MDRLLPLEILTFPEAGLPPDLRRQVVALFAEAGWGPPSDDTGLGHDPALRPVALVLTEAGRVKAALSVLSKPITHLGRPYAASGLSTVVTAAADRRRGHGRRMIVAARRVMGRAGADLALFTCDKPLAPFYESGGYEVLTGTVLVGGSREDPLPSDGLEKLTMWRHLTRRARDHAADFLGARIALYPGTVDRLW